MEIPVAINGYKVCCVLQLNTEAPYFQQLLKVKMVMSFRLPSSLIDSCAVEFLNVCSKALREPDAGLDLKAPGKWFEEILRDAARELTFRAAYAGHGSMPRLFDALNALSSKNYEGEKAYGRMLIITGTHPDLSMQIRFKEGIDLRDSGAARKILEMANIGNQFEDDESLYLLSTGHEIYGIGSLPNIRHKSYSEIYTIKFTGHYSWDLIYEDQTMMRVLYGQPSLPQKRLDEEKFKDHVLRRFPTGTPDVEKLQKIVSVAMKQSHGTMIVISNLASEEAERLGGQSTLIDPTILTEKNLLMLTAIDGALLVDTKGLCYAVGVILDGKAIAGKGTRARGARYNSAIRYIDSLDSDYESLVIVISEDGMVNLIPELNPRIYRLEIEKKLDLLREAINDELLKSKQYYKAMEWFQNHRFYLSKEDCQELNKIKTDSKIRLEKQEGMSKTPANFEVNTEMNDSYFLDEYLGV